MSTIVLYESVYGSTKQYAEALAERLGATAQEIPEDFSLISAAPTAPLIVLSPNYATQVKGAEFIANTDLGDRPIAICTVGMTLAEEAREKDNTGELLRLKEDEVTRFYLPGRMNYSEMSQPHRMMMRGMVTALRLKPRKSDNERAMIDSFNEDTDRVDPTELDPVVAWAQAQA